MTPSSEGVGVSARGCLSFTAPIPRLLVASVARSIYVPAQSAASNRQLFVASRLAVRKPLTPKPPHPEPHVACSVYVPAQSMPANRQFFFAYRVNIANEGKSVVMLKSR